MTSITMAKTMTNSKTIKLAMKTIGLGDKAGDLLNILDEMELNRRLKISMTQADRGEFVSDEKLEQELDEEFANGYYGRV